MDPRAPAFLSDIAQTEEPPLASAGGGSYEVMGRYGACLWDCLTIVFVMSAGSSLAPHPSSCILLTTGLALPHMPSPATAVAAEWHNPPPSPSVAQWPHTVPYHHQRPST